MKAVNRIIMGDKRVHMRLTCDLNQICGAHVLGVVANSESQSRTQDAAEEQRM